MSNVERLDIWAVVRTILERNPSIRAKELIAKVRNKTGLSRSTIYNHLYTYDNQDKICRDKGKYFLPGQFEVYVRTARFPKRRFASKADYEIALEHSKKLILGLEAILSEDRTWFPQEARRASEVEFGGKVLKRFVEEHLKSGYPHIYEKIKGYREVAKNTEAALLNRGYSKGVIDYLLKGISESFVPKEATEWNMYRSGPLTEIMKPKSDAFRELVAEIRLLEAKINMGEPLNGSCSVCPKVGIVK